MQRGIIKPRKRNAEPITTDPSEKSASEEWPNNPCTEHWTRLNVSEMVSCFDSANYGLITLHFQEFSTVDGITGILKGLHSPWNFQCLIAIQNLETVPRHLHQFDVVVFGTVSYSKVSNVHHWLPTIMTLLQQIPTNTTESQRYERTLTKIEAIAP